MTVWPVIAVSLGALAVYAALLAGVWLFITHEEAGATLADQKRAQAYKHAQRRISNNTN